MIKKLNRSILDIGNGRKLFGLPKGELINIQKFRSLRHFKQELIDYLDYYSDQPIKIKPKGLSHAIYRQ